jgi:PadR family transcriptional regulator AphA
MPARGATPYVILGLLRFGPLSGYQVRAELQSAASSFWSESYGQIYPALRALHRSGCVRLLARGHQPSRRRKAGRAATGRRAKSVYAITAKGRVEAWLGAPPRVEPPRHELLMKLYLADRAFLDKPEAWLRDLLEREIARLERLERMQRELPRAPHRHPNVRFWSFALAHGEVQARASVGWCRTVLASLAQLQQARDRRLAGAASRRALPFE